MKDDRYTGPRCAACSAPATCRVIKLKAIDAEGDLACDDCRPSEAGDLPGRIVWLPEAEAARDAQGQG